jgi:Tol biopolymer transport system component
VCHAAGHAVAALETGRSFTRVSIRSDGSGAIEGEFLLPRRRGADLTSEERASIDAEFVQLSAGPYAQQRLTGRNNTAWDKVAPVFFGLFEHDW